MDGHHASKILVPFVLTQRRRRRIGGRVLTKGLKTRKPQCLSLRLSTSSSSVAARAASNSPDNPAKRLLSWSASRSAAPALPWRACPPRTKYGEAGGPSRSQRDFVVCEFGQAT
jgi:hypothetical protein